MEVNKVEILDDFENMDWGLKAIKADEAWSKTQGEGVKIVLIDSGVDASHKDLNDKVKYNYNAIGKNFDVIDGSGHGTMTAGLLVGERTGVAPKAELYSIKVLDDSGNGTHSDVMDGITYAINLGADILSISLGVSHQMPLIMQQKIVDAYEKGITIVSAVGNNGWREPMYPAIMKEVIGVGGYDKNLIHADFSNRGHDILAPSVEILSTHKDGKYAKMTGTSFASPLVAGGIALLISYYRSAGRELTPKEIKEMLPRKFDLSKLI